MCYIWYRVPMKEPPVPQELLDEIIKEAIFSSDDPFVTAMLSSLVSSCFLPTCQSMLFEQIGIDKHYPPVKWLEFFIGRPHLATTIHKLVIDSFEEAWIPDLTILMPWLDTEMTPLTTFAPDPLPPLGNTMNMPELCSFMCFLAFLPLADNAQSWIPPHIMPAFRNLSVLSFRVQPFEFSVLMQIISQWKTHNKETLDLSKCEELKSIDFDDNRPTITSSLISILTLPCPGQLRDLTFHIKYTCLTRLLDDAAFYQLVQETYGGWILYDNQLSSMSVTGWQSETFLIELDWERPSASSHWYEDTSKSLQRIQNSQHKKRWRLQKKGMTADEALHAAPPVTGIPWRKSAKQQQSYLNKDGESPDSTIRRVARNQRKSETARARYHKSKTENGPLKKQADLVRDVTGNYISDCAECCVWQGDPQLDFYMGCVPGPDGTNLLVKEADFVCTIATTAPIIDESNDWIEVLMGLFLEQYLLVNKIQEAASRGKVVILHDYVPSMAHGQITVDFLQNKYNISPFVEVEEHDSIIKQCDRTNPTVVMTVGQFIEDIRDTSKSAMLLDLPMPRDTVPSQFHNLDDGSQAMAHTKFVNTKDFALPREHVTDCTWALLHHAGTLSRWHRDMDGKLSIIIVDRGCKLWIERHPWISLSWSQIDRWFVWSMEDNDKPSMTVGPGDTETSDAATLLILPGDVVVYMYDIKYQNLEAPQALAALCLMALAPGQYALRHRLASPFPQIFDDVKKKVHAYKQYEKWSMEQLKGTWAKKVPFYADARDYTTHICRHLQLATTTAPGTVA
ncbi:hypothetical protein ARMGADRAFT_1035318 [Armillaria gallica]|uniref:JmjC domain-containing protein n=1 Tax=Armillaria gallica TaxID=47427 RepID=A0A2H3D5R8_ARMGA|nr:hypothetical protein ARMGADRAFT_1035318 [Armillaria gallica]